jgi:phosphoenolpyruvate-protein kinase (PTS system EI component)
LSAFAASVGKLSPGLAEGFQDLIANAGVPVTAASRALIQNIPDATAIVQQLTAGTISSTEAMVQLRDAAQRSNQSLRGVAQTGTVEFARLYGEVNKLATAKFDEVAVTEEQRAKQEKLTKAATEFEDATKRLSSAFQGVETGFFKSLGAALGDAGGGINDGLKGLARGIDKLDPAVKAMLHLAISACRKLNKYVGICGQGPSDHPDFAQWLVEEGIETISLNPDTVVETWLYLAEQQKVTQ